MPINFSFLDFILALMPNYYDELKIEPFILVGKSGIKIKKKNRGKFTEYCGGTVTSACIARGKSSSNPVIRKRATFAANARKWKHLEGGVIKYGEGDEINSALDFRDNTNPDFAGEFVPANNDVLQASDNWSNKTESIDPDIVRPDLVLDDEEVVTSNKPTFNSTQSSPVIQQLFLQHSSKPQSDVNTLSQFATNSSGFNLLATLLYLRDHANSASTGYCAKYVRLALEAGGMDMTGRPNNANAYIGFLKNKGYQLISTGVGESLGGYIPQAGDIIIYKANARHRYGHIAMYDGLNWYSDFKLRSHKVWRDVEGEYIVLRRL